MTSIVIDYHTSEVMEIQRRLKKVPGNVESLDSQYRKVHLLPRDDPSPWVDMSWKTVNPGSMQPPEGRTFLSPWVYSINLPYTDSAGWIYKKSFESPEEYSTNNMMTMVRFRKWRRVSVPEDQVQLAVDIVERHQDDSDRTNAYNLPFIVNLFHESHRPPSAVNGSDGSAREVPPPQPVDAQLKRGASAGAVLGAQQRTAGAEISTPPFEFSLQVLCENRRLNISKANRRLKSVRRVAPSVAAAAAAEGGGKEENATRTTEEAATDSDDDDSPLAPPPLPEDPPRWTVHEVDRKYTSHLNCREMEEIFATYTSRAACTVHPPYNYTVQVATRSNTPRSSPTLPETPPEPKQQKAKRPSMLQRLRSATNIGTGHAHKEQAAGDNARTHAAVSHADAKPSAEEMAEAARSAAARAALDHQVALQTTQSYIPATAETLRIPSASCVMHDGVRQPSPEDWVPLCGWNFFVDFDTDDAGWQYSDSFYSLTETEHQESQGHAANVTRTKKFHIRNKSDWDRKFNEIVKSKDDHYVKRRRWCRVLVRYADLELCREHWRQYIADNRRGHIKSGVFYKQGHVRKNWKKRVFELNDYTLVYKTGENEARGSIPLLNKYLHYSNIGAFKEDQNGRSYACRLTDEFLYGAHYPMHRETEQEYASDRRMCISMDKNNAASASTQSSYGRSASTATALQGAVRLQDEQAASAARAVAFRGSHLTKSQSANLMLNHGATRPMLAPATQGQARRGSADSAGLKSLTAPAAASRGGGWGTKSVSGSSVFSSSIFGGNRDEQGNNGKRRKSMIVLNPTVRRMNREYLNMDMLSETQREDWMDALRHQIWLVDNANLHASSTLIKPLLLKEVRATNPGDYRVYDVEGSPPLDDDYAADALYFSKHQPVAMDSSTSEGRKLICRAKLNNYLAVVTIDYTIPPPYQMSEQQLAVLSPLYHIYPKNSVIKKRRELLLQRNASLASLSVQQDGSPVRKSHAAAEATSPDRGIENSAVSESNDSPVTADASESKLHSEEVGAAALEATPVADTSVPLSVEPAAPPSAGSLLAMQASASATAEKPDPASLQTDSNGQQTHPVPASKRPSIFQKMKSALGGAVPAQADVGARNGKDESSEEAQSRSIVLEPASVSSATAAPTDKILRPASAESIASSPETNNSTLSRTVKITEVTKFRIPYSIARGMTLKKKLSSESSFNPRYIWISCARVRDTSCITDSSKVVRTWRLYWAKSDIQLSTVKSVDIDDIVACTEATRKRSGNVIFGKKADTSHREFSIVVRNRTRPAVTTDYIHNVSSTPTTGSSTSIGDADDTKVARTHTNIFVSTDSKFDSAISGIDFKTNSAEVTKEWIRVINELMEHVQKYNDDHQLALSAHNNLAAGDEILSL